MAIIPDECKFHVVSEGVDTVDRGSKLAQSKRESITMADIKQSIPTPEGIFERGAGEYSIIPVRNDDYKNIATADGATISGGAYNFILNDLPPGSQGGIYNLGDVISGGYYNQIETCGYRGNLNNIGGGAFHEIKSNGVTSQFGESYTKYNSIQGGEGNCIIGYVKASAISGGIGNKIKNDCFGGTSCSTIGGGEFNCICSKITTGGTYYANLTGSVVSGGSRNKVCGVDNSDLRNSIISGGCRNTVYGVGNLGAMACVKFSVISGGSCNQILSEAQCVSYGTISGGRCNIIKGVEGGERVCFATIGGGYGNHSYSEMSTVSGGYSNGICSKNSYGTVSGGCNNKIYGEFNAGVFIGGGVSNNVNAYNACYSTITGGYNNSITAPYVVLGDSGYAPYNTISGGNNNKINTTLDGFSKSSVIAGGESNTITGNLSYYSTISGGYDNCISGGYAPRNIISGGANNCIANGNTSVIGGGRYNQINGAYWSGIMSGQCNVISGGYHQTILGGVSNTNSSYKSHVIGSNITTDRVCTAFVNNLSIKSIPTVVTGLPAGSVWNNAGVLNIV